MSKKGFLKIRFFSVKGLRGKNQGCLVKASAIDTNISTNVYQKQIENQDEFYLPITEKIQIELHTGTENIGYFQLPMKKIYEFPSKKHIITVSCITKDTVSNSINPQIFGVLKLSLMFFQNHIAKLDVFIDKIQLAEENPQEGQRELFVQCVVGNVSSQTTLKKKGEESIFQWKEVLPFTLESIPGKIELSIKEKDMINGETLGIITLDPQQQKFLEQSNNKQERKYQINTEARKITIYLSKIFKIPENQ